MHHGGDRGVNERRARLLMIHAASPPSMCNTDSRRSPGVLSTGPATTTCSRSRIQARISPTMNTSSPSSFLYGIVPAEVALHSHDLTSDPIYLPVRPTRG